MMPNTQPSDYLSSLAALPAGSFQNQLHDKSVLMVVALGIMSGSARCSLPVETIASRSGLSIPETNFALDRLLRGGFVIKCIDFTGQSWELLPIPGHLVPQHAVGKPVKGRFRVEEWDFS